MIKDKKSNGFQSIKNMCYLNILPLTINRLQPKSWNLTDTIIPTLFKTGIIQKQVCFEICINWIKIISGVL